MQRHACTSIACCCLMKELAIYIAIMVNFEYMQMHAYTESGADPERGSEYRGDLNIEVISEAGGHSTPEATGCFINITPKSCLMQDLEHI